MKQSTPSNGEIDPFPGANATFASGGLACHPFDCLWAQVSLPDRARLTS